MNSLMNYGSDGENSNDSDDGLSNVVNKTAVTVRKVNDAIYDPVPMDMSEESNNNSSDNSGSERSPHRSLVSNSHRTDSTRHASSLPDQRRIDHEDRSSSSHDDHKNNDKTDQSKLDKYERNSRHSSDRKGDDKRRVNDYKDSKDSKRHKDDDKKSREDKKSRDDDRRKDKDKNDDKNDRDHHREDRRDRDRRDDREKRRDRDREKDRDRDRVKDKSRDRSRDKDRDRSRDRDRDRDRRHSKDEKSRDRHRDDRHSRDKERVRSRSRSRSRSRDRGSSHRPFSYREGRNKTKLAQLEKLGIEIKATECDIINNSQEQNYYNPLATATQGKYAEQIQKRKLLWANKKQDENKTSTVAASTANTWVGTTFTHDQDGKVTAKFKRLMGIKEDVQSNLTSGSKPDILKKQEEMFNNMEQQYEVARATTHTQRGVGLGYASGGFSFPR